MADQCIPLRSLAPEIECALAVVPEGYAFRLGSGGVEITPPSREAIYVLVNGGPRRWLTRSQPSNQAVEYASALLSASMLQREGTATPPMLAALARHD